MNQLFNIGQFFNRSSLLPLVLFLTLWVGFPVWLSLRRTQGLIKLEKPNREGDMEPIGMYLELGVFFIAIPFTTAFFILLLNMILLPFIVDSSIRGQKSLEGALIIIAIALFLYTNKYQHTSVLHLQSVRIV